MQQLQRSKNRSNKKKFLIPHEKKKTWEVPFLRQLRQWKNLEKKKALDQLYMYRRGLEKKKKTSGSVYPFSVWTPKNAANDRKA